MVDTRRVDGKVRRLSSFVINVGSEYVSYFLLATFFLGSLLSFIAFANTVLRAPVSRGCIIPWCLVQCLLHFWTNIFTDCLIDLTQLMTFMCNMCVAMTDSSKSKKCKND